MINTKKKGPSLGSNSEQILQTNIQHEIKDPIFFLQ